MSKRSLKLSLAWEVHLFSIFISAHCRRLCGQGGWRMIQLAWLLILSHPSNLYYYHQLQGRSKMCLPHSLERNIKTLWVNLQTNFQLLVLWRNCSKKVLLCLLKGMIDYYFIYFCSWKAWNDVWKTFYYNHSHSFVIHQISINQISKEVYLISHDEFNQGVILPNLLYW